MLVYGWSKKGGPHVNAKSCMSKSHRQQWTVGIVKDNDKRAQMMTAKP